MLSLIEILNIAAAIVTILGLPIILWQLWINDRQGRFEDLQERRQLIESLTAILQPVGHWARADKGGYSASMVQELMSNKDLQNPFYRVFRISNPLSSIFTLPGIVHFDNSFQRALVGLDQAIVSFHSRLDFIEKFVFSKPELIAEVNENRDLSPQAIDFRDTMHSLQIELHLDGIGDQNKRALYYWYKMLADRVLLAKIELECDLRKYHHVWYRCVWNSLPCVYRLIPRSFGSRSQSEK